MRLNRKFLMMVPLFIFLSGCLTSKEQNYKFDYDTGIFEVSFHDLRSQKQDKDKEDYMEKDWASLKEAVNKKDDYKPDVVSIVSKKLFQEGDALSGKSVYQVKCVKCFSSQADILKLLYEDGHWEIMNDEIFLILPSRMLLTATNGQLIKTEKNTVCVWPTGAKKFEFTIFDSQASGESLLGKYLSESK